LKNRFLGLTASLRDARILGDVIPALKGRAKVITTLRVVRAGIGLATFGRAVSAQRHD